ncbi:MAG: PD-(D/E)XK nuclease family protein [Lachnospiraceae bacterium]|nr:PD-(D/E)XK nuclease family protein [Lachnospiraceae bacterium]
MNKEELLNIKIEHMRMQPPDDSCDHTILNVLNREYDETHVHSRILFYLFTHPYGGCDYFTLFLGRLGLWDEKSKEKYMVYRERSFGNGRIDFVFESAQKCIALEMKIDAADGKEQLARYEEFCKSRKKPYRIFYLTPYGDLPSEQSVGSLDREIISCISFEKEIYEWLKECLQYTDKDSYMYSFIKQYAGTVKRITGRMSDEISESIIKNKESAMAAYQISNELTDRMSQVFVDFMKGLSDYIERETALDTRIFTEDIEQYMYQVRYNYCNGMYPILDRTAFEGGEFHFFFYIDVGNDYINAGLGFEDENNEWVTLEKVEETTPEFYNKWKARIEKLHLSDVKTSKNSWWFPIENTRGERFYIKNFATTGAMFELIDTMDAEVEYIGDYIVSQIINKLI